MSFHIPASESDTCYLLYDVTLFLTTEMWHLEVLCVQQFRVKTKFGGAVSIICVVVMVLLFASEIRLYLTPEVREELVVDTTRTGKLKINIDFVFSR